MGLIGRQVLHELEVRGTHSADVQNKDQLEHRAQLAGVVHDETRGLVLGVALLTRLIELVFEDKHLGQSFLHELVIGGVGYLVPAFGTYGSSSTCVTCLRHES